MAPLMFKDSFWSTEFTCHAGYEALIQRLRDGGLMCKDVEELLKMRALAEEKYGKELITIVRKTGGHTEISTLRASFEQLKTQIENIGNFHIHLSDILKEEVKKIETFRERQKEQRKKFQSIMEKIQKKKVSWYKRTLESKKNYELRCKEADEAEQGAENTTAACKNSDKMLQKAKQHRQTASEAEKLYFKNVLQLENIRKDWCETHKSTCEVFQQLEVDRINILRYSMWDHCNHFSMQCVKDDEFYEEVRKTLEQCDITTDNNCFIGMKSTGCRPPDPIVFESYYQRDPPRDSNGRAHFAGGDLRRPVSVTSSEGLLTDSISTDNQQNSASAETSIGETSEDISDDGYVPLPCLQYTAPPPVVSADEDRYVVLYEYTAREEDELTISRGDMVRVLERGEDGWWKVDKDGFRGLVPWNFLGKT